MPIRYGATRSPTFHSLGDARARRLTIVPASSSPMISGSSSGKREMPSRKSTSRWLSAQAPTLTTTSPGPATGSGTDSTTSLSRPPYSWNRSAFTWPPGSSAALGQTIVALPRAACASTAALIEIAASAASAQALSQAGRPAGAVGHEAEQRRHDDGAGEDDAQRAARDAPDLARSAPTRRRASCRPRSSRCSRSRRVRRRARSARRTAAARGPSCRPC